MAKIILSFVFFIGFFPVSGIAQSFWLHKQIGGSGGHFAAIDSADCVLAYNPDFEYVTQDYWNSWNTVIADSPKYTLRTYAYAGFCHPSHNLLLVGCNDRSVGVIVRSTDGGTTWRDSSIGSYVKAQPGNGITAMAALDSNHIVVLIDSAVGYNGNLISTDHVLISSDGGIVWQSVSTPIFQYDSPSSGLPLNPVVSYLPPNTLLVAAMQQYGNSTIFRSSDLGATWDSGSVAGKVITKFAFINPLLGFASGTLFDLNAKTETATIDKTTDGGQTWTTIFTKQIIVSPGSYYNATAGLYSIAFADSLHGFACGPWGLILRTNDGGVTWNQMNSDYTDDAEGNDLLSDVAYPDTNHAMIASSDGSVLVYHPNGILSLPNITFPLFSPPAAPQTFDVTWDSVPGATRYSISITTSNYPNPGDTTIALDSNVTDTFYQLSNLVDTSPPPESGGRQYEIYLQAFNASNQSNVAERAFIVYAPSNVVTKVPEDSVFSIVVYPNPAHGVLNMEGFSGKVTVIDALGRTRDCPWENGNLNIANLPAGIYYVSDGYSRAKFVKQ